MDRKLAVFFPGIGYTMDRPLLHFSRRIAADLGYELRPLPYTGFPSGVRGDREKMEAFLSWRRNGCDTTLEEFGRLDAEMRQEVMDYLMDLLLYEELTAGGKHYLLVHGGLGNYRPDKEISEYTLKELVWDRADYETRYFTDTYVVSGHTPTQFIEGNPRPGYVYRKNNHIAIDCGCYLPGGRLAAMCLETGEEFYSSAHPL